MEFGGVFFGVGGDDHDDDDDDDSLSQQSRQQCNTGVRESWWSLFKLGLCIGYKMVQVRTDKKSSDRFLLSSTCDSSHLDRHPYR